MSPLCLRSSQKATNSACGRFLCYCKSCVSSGHLRTPDDVCSWVILKCTLHVAALLMVYASLSLLSSWCAYIICNPNPGLGLFSVPHCLITIQHSTPLHFICLYPLGLILFFSKYYHTCSLHYNVLSISTTHLCSGSTAQSDHKQI